MRRPSRTRILAAALLAALSLTATACTSSDDSAGDDPATTAPSEPSESTDETTEPTAGETTPAETTAAGTTAPSSSSPTSEPTPTEQPGGDSPGSRARRALIPAAAMPGLNESWVWDGSATTDGTGESLPGVCLQSPLTSIGGFQEVRRDYSSTLSDDAGAAMISVVFPDAQTARTAVAVLAAWQQRCQKHASTELGLDDVRVSEPGSVQTAVGAASHWLVTYGPGPDADSQWFDAEGYVLDGDTLSYLVIQVASQDYNYPSGRSPIEEALRVAGTRLERTR